MIRVEIKRLKTGAPELRKFGLMIGGVFALLGCWFWWRGKTHFAYFLVPGVLLTLLGALVPRVLKLIYIGWMSLAFILGFAVSTTLLTLFFYLIVTPVGLIARLAGRDFLNRKFDRRTTTYWIKRDRSSSAQTRNYEQQF
jgi:Saxitoxin biosynthesis operon protein SxtJ